MKALEYKECFTHTAFKKMTKSLQNIKLFLDIQYRMFGQVVSINYDYDLWNIDVRKIFLPHLINELCAGKSLLVLYLFNVYVVDG
jgi:hypothetical protein